MRESLHYSKDNGYTLIPTGKREVPMQEVYNLYKLSKSRIYLTKKEQDELRDIFSRYTLIFIDNHWMSMKLRPQYYPVDGLFSKVL